jgi:ribonuclease HI
LDEWCAQQNADKAKHMSTKTKRNDLLSVTLIFDGGSKGNPGPTYGSYLIKSPGLPGSQVMRLSWGRGTNNEAEYRSLISGLRGLLHQLRDKGIDPGSVRLRVAGDSNLVLNQLAGEWKVKSPRMRELRDEAAPLLACFRDVDFVHHDRKVSVRLLGH